VDFAQRAQGFVMIPVNKVCENFRLSPVITANLNEITSALLTIINLILATLTKDNVDYMRPLVKDLVFGISFYVQ